MLPSQQTPGRGDISVTDLLVILLLVVVFIALIKVF